MDIVERLRLRIHTSEDETALTNEAADEIERLQKDISAYWKEMELMRSDLAIYSEMIEQLRETLNNLDKGINQWLPTESMIKKSLLKLIDDALKEGP